MIAVALVTPGSCVNARSVSGSLEVSAQSNIYGAGKTAVPASPDDSGGKLPPAIALPPGKARVVTLPAGYRFCLLLRVKTGQLQRV